MVDAVDRAIINLLQSGFPVCERPFAEVGASLGLSEDVLIDRLRDLLARGKLSRFGPMYNADRMGGAFCLCALAVPPERFEEVAAIVNRQPEVAHNYEREHALNMWFVIAAERPDQIGEVLTKIKTESGIEPYAFPKLEEYFVGLRIEV
jgi:DNA-binding Lrp family transcriptional regulator